MNTKLTDEKGAGELKNDFPEMFEDVRCGVSYGRGWHDLIYRLCEFIYYYKQYGIIARVAQVKEKFGTLRFYFDTELKKHKIYKKQDQIGMMSRINGAVAFAEYLSGTICEDCGKDGKLREG